MQQFEGWESRLYRSLKNKMAAPMSRKCFWFVGKHLPNLSILQPSQTIRPLQSSYICYGALFQSHDNSYDIVSSAKTPLCGQGFSHSNFSPTCRSLHVSQFCRQMRLRTPYEDPYMYRDPEELKQEKLERAAASKQSQHELDYHGWVCHIL